MAGLTPADVDVLELYDINSFEIARQLEILGFCSDGEGCDLAAERGLGVDGGLPTNTDGGLMSFSHTGLGGPTLKVVEAVRQLRGECGHLQVKGAEVALLTGAGSGAQYHNVLLLGRDR
jgi:acetyl-CoA acetyltransferase